MHKLTTALFVMLLAIGVARGEVSMTSADGPGGLVILAAIGEGPDPIGIWLPVRPLPAGRVLNASGDSRGDGKPDDAHDPVTGYSSVVWAYNAGSDFDVAYAEWDGAQWTPTEFLTSATTDQIDPRVWVQPDGTTHVVWWEDGATDAVFLLTRPAGQTLWNAPVQVSEASKSARRPSVTHHNGIVQVVYEQDSATIGMVHDVTVAKEIGGGQFSRSIVFSTDRTERLDAMIHAQGNVLWLDWKDDGNIVGCATWNGADWSIDPPEPWLDPSWVGAEETRRAVRSRVLP